MTVQRYLQDLADPSKPVRHSGLLRFSGLSPEEVVEFRAAWDRLPVQRRREIMSRMVELGEDNLELDFGPVFRACLTDSDDEVREKATRGLWESDDRITVRPLIELLKKDPSAKVRATAAMALGKFAALAQEGKLLRRDGDRIRQALLEVIRQGTEDPEVVRRAIEAVASFNTPEIKEIIRKAYRSGDSRFKQSAIYAMGQSSDPEWLPIVLHEMESDDPAIRYEAANACGLLGDEDIVPHLARLLKDEDVQVQLSAINALGHIGGPLAKKVLLQCLRHGDDAIEEAAQEALANIEFDEDPLGFRFQA